MTSDVISIEVVFNKPFTVELRSRAEWKAQKGPYSVHVLVWYTDGSLIDGKSGYGLFSILPRAEFCASLGQY